MLIKVVKHEHHPKDHNVITYGEFGTEFYILMKGSVAVRIPLLMKNDFTFRELLQYLVEHKDWLIKNEKYQQVLSIVQDFIPEIIKFTGKGYLYMNHELAEKVATNAIILGSQSRFKSFFPNFGDLMRYKSKIDSHGKMHIKLDIMFHVDTFQAGRSFGELALMNNTRRSATIVTLEDCDFGVIAKKDFDKVMGKILKKKFANKVAFLNKFIFLKNVSRIRKEKI